MKQIRITGAVMKVQGCRTCPCRGGEGHAPDICALNGKRVTQLGTAKLLDYAPTECPLEEEPTPPDLIKMMLEDIYKDAPIRPADREERERATISFLRQRIATLETALGKHIAQPHPPGCGRCSPNTSTFTIFVDEKTINPLTPTSGTTWSPCNKCQRLLRFNREHPNGYVGDGHPCAVCSDNPNRVTCGDGSGK